MYFDWQLCVNAIMADAYDERFQKGIKKMQSLGESMEETINQHRKKPKLVCNNIALKILTQKAHNVYNEMDCCQNGVDETTATLISDKTEAEKKIQECENKVATAEYEIRTLNVSIADEERGIRVCEQQIRKLEEILEQGRKANENRRENMETSGNVAVGTGLASLPFYAGALFLPPLLIPAVILTAPCVGGTVVHISESKKGEVNSDEIRNRMQIQRNNINLYQSKC
uniref:Uncharacterized protein n=1 Tax=Panagrolaimus davidi TaxID=227884 RepID=A0A914QLN0_9BILA